MPLLACGRAQHSELSLRLLPLQKMASSEIKSETVHFYIKSRDDFYLTKTNSLESLDEFFKNFKEKWDAVERIEIASLKTLKVTSSIFGGSISVRYEGKKLFSPIVTRIASKTERRGVKAFYDGVTK